MTTYVPSGGRRTPLEGAMDGAGSTFMIGFATVANLSEEGRTPKCGPAADGDVSKTLAHTSSAILGKSPTGSPNYPWALWF